MADLPRAPQPAAMPRALALFVAGVERLAGVITRHWAAALNLILLAYVGFAFLAPLLMQMGAPLPARILYLLYTPFCHQLPERSYFLFGEAPLYTTADLQNDQVLAGADILSRRQYIGDPEHGYKVAFCERDVAIYGAMFVGGVLLALRRMRVPRLSIKVYLLFLLPLALDGLTQLLGLRESTWWLRTLTGGLFGLATVWLVYPYLGATLQPGPTAAGESRQEERS